MTSVAAPWPEQDTADDKQRSTPRDDVTPWHMAFFIFQRSQAQVYHIALTCLILRGVHNNTLSIIPQVQTYRSILTGLILPTTGHNALSTVQAYPDALVAENDGGVDDIGGSQEGVVRVAEAIHLGELEVVNHHSLVVLDMIGRGIKTMACQDSFEDLVQL